MNGWRWHCRRTAAALSSYVFGTRAALAIIGFICRHVLRMPIVSVFLLYPARKEYADALAYEWHQRRFSWYPGLVGLYRQGRRYGLTLGYSRDVANCHRNLSGRSLDWLSRTRRGLPPPYVLTVRAAIS